MERFTQQNTHEYSDADLAELNRRYGAAVSTIDPDDEGLESVRKHIAQRIVQAFDSETSAKERAA